MPRRPRALHGGHEAVDHLVEGVVADDEVLGEGLQPKDARERAGKLGGELGALALALAPSGVAVADAATRAASTASTVGAQPRNAASSLRAQRKKMVVGAWRWCISASPLSLKKRW